MIESTGHVYVNNILDLILRGYIHVTRAFLILMSLLMFDIVHVLFDFICYHI